MKSIFIKPKNKKEFDIALHSSIEFGKDHDRFKWKGNEDFCVVILHNVDDANKNSPLDNIPTSKQKK
jgi:hypothetical protein